MRHILSTYSIIEKISRAAVPLKHFYFIVSQGAMRATYPFTIQK